MLQPPKKYPEITEILAGKNVRLFIKREDQVHAEISGNKYWKLFFNVNDYLQKFSSKNFHNSTISHSPQFPPSPLIITFGGAFSNHISAVAALGRDLEVKTLGIIRGEEISEKISENPTLDFAEKCGMQLQFVTRENYRDKFSLTKNLQVEFPGALIIPEGGTNPDAARGIQFMLSAETAQFDYLCAAVGTGGTLAGISKFAESGQKVLGLNVVKDASLAGKIFNLSGRENFELVDASFGGYGKITDEVVAFVNWFYEKFQIPLEPIYTGKMMMKIFDLVENDFFPGGSEILAFHTGGLQGIAGANAFLRSKNRPTINF